MDELLRSICPTVTAPRYSPHQSLHTVGHRFVAAEDGLYVELYRPWAYVLTQVAPSAIRLPYGPLVPTVNFKLAELREHLQRFIREARGSFPLEHAAWLCSDARGTSLTYTAVDVLSSSKSAIQYLRPEATPACFPAVDIHSHGQYEAFFSAEDDADSSDDAKLEIVVGNLDRERPTLVCRLSLLGLHLDYSEWIKQFSYDEG